MTVTYETILNDLHHLSYWDIPSVSHIKLMTFTESDIANLPTTYFTYISPFPYGERRAYAVILLLISLQHYDPKMKIKWLVDDFFNIIITDKNFKRSGDLEEWLVSELYSNNGDLDGFVKEYNRLKLTNSDILKDL